MTTNTTWGGRAVLTLPSLCLAISAVAADNKGPTRKACEGFEMPHEERLIRACDANYGLCAKPTATWQKDGQIQQVCQAIARERKIQAGALLNPQPSANPVRPKSPLMVPPTAQPLPPAPLLAPGR